MVKVMKVAGLVVAVNGVKMVVVNEIKMMDLGGVARVFT